MNAFKNIVTPIYRVKTTLFRRLMFLSILLVFVANSPKSVALKNQISLYQHAEKKLENPMSLEYLIANLRMERPRLMLTPTSDRHIREQLSNESLVQSYFRALYQDAAEILELPLLEKSYSDQRRHMLSLAREKKRRLGLLAIVYRYSREQRFLDRLNDELINICKYDDWNPHHWLDTATLSMGFAMALDWAGEDLPPETVELAEITLIEHGIKPLFEGNPEHIWWVDVNHNWNQVGHGGLIAASITIAHRDPALAAKTISFALDHMHYALNEYGPDGIFPEGLTYWEFGTIYSAISATMLNSAFGHDFGITQYPGLLQSAKVRMMGVAPSGELFNYSDAGSNLSDTRVGVELHQARFNRARATQLLTWFAVQTGNSLYFDPTFFEALPTDGRSRERNGPPSLIWLAQMDEPLNFDPLPNIWHGEGKNSIAIFRNDDDDPDKFYLGMKGGQANINHGHMDAGSFVFELDGIRWSVDMGSGGARGEVHAAGKDYWDRTQNAFRWSLLPMSNRGHSTLRINNSRHNVDGNARIIYFSDGSNGTPPETVFDMSEVFRGQLASLHRRFVKEDARSIRIEDRIKPNDSTEMVIWQMMTTAAVIIADDGALLEQDGKKLRLHIESPAGLSVSVISLNPPPGRFDLNIPGLKRIEVHLPAYLMHEEVLLSIRLSGN
jgi:hypothetical protein